MTSFLERVYISHLWSTPVAFPFCRTYNLLWQSHGVMDRMCSKPPSAGASDTSKAEFEIPGADPPAASGRGIPLDRDAPCVLSRFRYVIGELHPEKVIHVRTERLFDA